MVAGRGRRVGRLEFPNLRQAFPNLSLRSQAVLFMAFRYIVRELFFSCLSSWFHTSHTQLSFNLMSPWEM